MSNRILGNAFKEIQDYLKSVNQAIGGKATDFKINAKPLIPSPMAVSLENLAGAGATLVRSRDKLRTETGTETDSANSDKNQTTEEEAS